MLRIFSHIRIKPGQLVALVVFMLVASACEMLIPTQLARMIDSGVAASDASVISQTALAMVVVLIASTAANIASTWFSSAISSRMSADLRRAMFTKVESFSAAEVDRFSTASLITRSTSDVSSIQGFVSMLLRIGITAPLTIVSGLVASSATGGGLAGVLNISIPVLVVSAAAIIFLSSRYSLRLREKVDVINRVFLEMLEGVRVIRAFNKEDFEVARFGDANEDYARTSVAASRTRGLMHPVIQLIFGLTTAAVMFLGAIFASQGKMDVGALVANTQFISFILMSVTMFTMVAQQLPDFYACATRCGEVLDSQSSIADGPRAADERPERGTVEFRDVTFSYPDADAPAVSGVSFRVEQGQTVGIIGATGSGKSSILRLIPRLYDPLFGTVLVDGMDVRDYRLAELRSLIGYVPQKTVLFSGDVSSNLAFGDADADAARMDEALELAVADAFVAEKDGGLEAEVGQGGRNFSGGQRQRLSIARALVRDAEIFLFDDSFSALDAATDRRLRANLRERLAGTTAIIVAQRVSSIMDADRILVLDAGSVIASGTHAELLESCSLYREICELQLGEGVGADASGK